LRASYRFAPLIEPRGEQNFWQPAARYQRVPPTIGGKNVIVPRVLLVMLAGTALSIAGITIDAGTRWSWLQRRLFPTYLSTLEFDGKGRFTFLMILYPDGWRLASNEDVIHALSSARSFSSPQDFELSQHARSLGATRLEWRNYNRLDSQIAYEWLRQRVYKGRSPWQLTRWPACPGFLLVTAMVPWMVFRGRKAHRKSKQGHVLRGPNLVTPHQFNAHTHLSGIGIQTFEPLKRWDRLFRRTPRYCSVRVARHDETSHFAFVGDSGTGKSSLIRQLLSQIRERGHSAVIYDPAHEFTPQFYDPDSDVILNPTDRRMPFWSPSEEVQHPAEAMALANSLFPDKPRENNFFTEVSRKIFAHLLRYQPTPQDLTKWMKNLEEVDLRVAGTELEAMIPKRAVSQRAAVQGTFNQAAAAFQLLPNESEATGRWSAVSWARRRKGWLFFPSSPAHREGLRPLISLWLDSLILHLMESDPDPGLPVWFILDELASLQRLPQLPTILTQGRKANVCVVLGFQGRSQLQSLYDHQSEVMLSQPLTKIFLRTSEPDAAEWVSRSIGVIEVLRLEESHTISLRGRQNSKTSHWRRRTEPLVMSSEIAALQNLTGYLKSRDLVVPLSFGYVAPENKQPAFMARPLPELEHLSAPDIRDSDPMLRERQKRQKRTPEPKAPRTEKSRSRGSDSSLKLFDS
jgi:Type IV secretion-system coupling protein DNA-binding domain